jgi:predicted amidophosphoribosyltransferase
MAIKSDAMSSEHGVSMSTYVARRLQQELGGSPIEHLFHDRVTLVPTPKSSILLRNALWPAQRLCNAIAAAGLANSVLECLQRSVAVRKSAFAPRGERPTPQTHFESMEVRGALATATDEILVVDDIVTKGATLLAAVSLVGAALPQATVRGFAVVRTKGFVQDIESIVEPRAGTIVLTAWGEAQRDP